jgi:hypothetical protein
MILLEKLIAGQLVKKLATYVDGRFITACQVNPIHYVSFYSLTVKVKLSLCVINETSRHEDVWRSGSIGPAFLT